jgi:alkylation response protein AidB-like acyl-CoA dehydrogenase
LTKLGAPDGSSPTLASDLPKAPPHDAVPTALPEWLRKASRFCKDPVKTARELRPVLEAGAEEGARTGRLTDEVVRALAGSGLFGLRISRDVGGVEADPRTYIDAISELCYADGSAGWATMASGFTAGGNSVHLGPAATERIFHGDDGFMAAGQISNLGKAEPLPGGGYRVSGLFHFGSGSQFASWFIGTFQIHRDGKPAVDGKGRPEFVVCCAPRQNIRLKGNWDVIGLSATGSYDFEFPEQEIAEEFVYSVPGREPRGGPIHRLGGSIGHASWALGNGDRILDEIKTLATSKRRFQRATLIDMPVFQREYGQHRAAMSACRALIYQVYDEWFAAAQRGEAPLDVRARARLAACWTTEVALKAGQFAMFAAGSDGIRNRDGTNVLQRCFRDLQTGATHRHVDGNTLIEAAQVDLGVADPDVEM